MKKLYIILLMSLVCFSNKLMAQGEIENKTEYRYANFVLGINHGFGSALGGETEDLLLHTAHGDMHQNKKGFTYTPGFEVGIVYNVDFKNNKTGLQIGGKIVDYGFQNKYTSENDEHNVKETFRALGFQIPIFFKFGFSDIYRDMSYCYIGVQPTVNFMMSRGLKASWSSDKYGEKLSDGKQMLTVAATLGFNYDILSINFNYMFMDMVDPSFEDAKGFKPFSGIKGHIYVCTSLNVPMTRWITIHNWTAEKIRRKLKNGKSI